MKVDRFFSDADLAASYDVLHPPEQRGDFRFYLPLVMSARAVLDVGCGTGALLRLAREAGHTGRLCGLDPGAGMLAQAGERSDIEWVLGDLSSIDWERQFDLIVMTGHAFQVLLGDEELHTSLAAVRAALTERGRFAFETRNPLVREWEGWNAEPPVEAIDASGAVVRMDREVEAFEDGFLRFTLTFTSPGWSQPQVSRSTLRFLGADALASFLSSAGLAVEAQFGDWGSEALTPASPEIITIARRGP